MTHHGELLSAFDFVHDGKRFFCYVDANARAKPVLLRWALQIDEQRQDFTLDVRPDDTELRVRDAVLAWYSTRTITHGGIARCRTASTASPQPGSTGSASSPPSGSGS